MSAPPGNPSLDEQVQAEAARLLPTELARIQLRREIAARGRQPIVMVPAAEVRKRKMPPFLVEGKIPARGIGVFFGESGQHKSFLKLHLLLCVSNGRPFLGCQVNAPAAEKGWAVYVLGEGQYDAGLRVDAACLVHGFSDERLAYVEQPFPLGDESAVAEVIELCKALPGPVRIIAFDSLADFYGGDDSENSSTDMQRLIGGMKRISAELSCVVAAVAHTGHGGKDADGEDKPAPARLRGSSRFRQAFDFEFMVEGGRMIATKERYAEKGEPIRFGMENSGGTLVISQATGGKPAAAEEPCWPHPATEAQFGKIVAAIRQTPGMSMSAIARAAKVRKEDTAIVLLKLEEVSMVVNDSKTATGKYKPGPVYTEWLPAYINRISGLNGQSGSAVPGGSQVVPGTGSRFPTP